MATVSELYPVPYNVLASSPSRLSSNWDEFQEIFNGVKEAFGEFQKTGQLQKEAIQQGWNAYRGGKIDYLALVKASLSIVGLIVPGGEAAVPFIGMFLDFVWPKLFGGTSDDNTTLLNIINDAVNKILDKRLSDQQLSTVNNILNGFQSQVVQLNQKILSATFDTTTQKPRTPSPSDLQNVYGEFNLEQGLIHNNLYEFILEDYEDITLPMYVMAITIKLLTYQAFIQFANQWIDTVYPDTTSGEGYTFKTNLDLAKKNMLNDINEGSQHVLSVFKNHMVPIGVNKLQHNLHNRYVNTMVLQCFDFVTMWPTLYPDLYPADTSLDLTRVLFSDIVGPDESHDGNVTLYNILDSPQGYRHNPINLEDIFYLRKELEQVQLAQHSGSNKCWPYGIGLKYVGDPSIYKYGSNDPSNDFSTTIPTPITAINADTQYIHGTNLDMENISMDNGDYTLGSHCYIPGHDGSEGYARSNNSPLSNQKINALYPVTAEHVAGDQGKLGLLATHVPFDLVPQNIIGQPDTDGTIAGRGFPAEKGTIANIGSLQTVPEHINGANAVKLNFQQILAIPITSVTSGYYSIRIRYASSSDITGYFHVQTPTGDSNRGSITFPNTQNTSDKIYVTGENGNYMLFTAAQAIKFPSGQSTIYIQNNSNADFFLDRIEVIPITASQLPAPSSANQFTFVGPYTVLPEPVGKDFVIWQTSQTCAYTPNSTLSFTILGSGEFQALDKNNNIIARRVENQNNQTTETWNLPQNVEKIRFVANDYAVLRNIIGKINCQEPIKPCTLGGKTLVDIDYNANGEQVLWSSTEPMGNCTVDIVLDSDFISSIATLQFQDNTGTVVRSIDFGPGEQNQTVSVASTTKIVLKPTTFGPISGHLKIQVVTN
ncbi:insecticidal delta-endotoxin Cry8Ea1 family protein [Bacillus paranthracis]|uniref:insecticidal delta-endotoxin Cry8Ea1 family protein n=1 Tax=Bacillus paranthracis TaxID=2026186 RepID=UPI003D651C24